MIGLWLDRFGWIIDGAGGPAGLEVFTSWGMRACIRTGRLGKLLGWARIPISSYPKKGVLL